MQPLSISPISSPISVVFGGGSPIATPTKNNRIRGVTVSMASLVGFFVVCSIVRSKLGAHDVVGRLTEVRYFKATTDTTKFDDYGRGSAFCLLIKDDNDILPEWIAYHYHVFNLRRLIVAMDPDSKTSPYDILNSWTATGSGNRFNLTVTLWRDEDYTPSFFHGSNKTYSQIPNSVGKEVTYVIKPEIRNNAADINRPIRKTIWHRNETYVKLHQEEVRQQVHQINNHRFRQKNFVSECFRKVKEERLEGSNISWTVHVDTDEYLVPNPWIVSEVRRQHTDELVPYNTAAVTNSSRQDFFANVDAMYPNEPSDGSLWNFFRAYSKAVNPTLQTRIIKEGKTTIAKNFNGRACLMMPRILFGSKEDGATDINTTEEQQINNFTYTTKTLGNDTVANTYMYNRTKFGTLRWKYHSDFSSSARPKSMVNVHRLALSSSSLTREDKIFSTRTAFSIHKPLTERLEDGSRSCAKEPLSIANPHRYAEPLAVYHYLGSLERYLSRGDARRDASVHRRYDLKANYAKGDTNYNIGTAPQKNTPWWIGGWLDNFVQTHGVEVVTKVLGDHYLIKK